MEQMRISSYCGGFNLYEVMISINAVGIISDLITVSLLPLLDRSEFVNTVDQFKYTLRQAKWLALTKRKSHQINSDSGFLMLQNKIVGSYQTVSQVKYRKKYWSVQTAGLHSVHSGSHLEAISLPKMKTTVQKLLSDR